MLIDLSHRLHVGMRPDPGLAGPRVEVTVSRAESAQRLSNGVSFEIATLCLVANTGTYLDAPFHYFADGADVAALKLEQLIELPVIVIDALGQRAIDASAIDSAAINASVLDGLNLAGAAVLFRTDWSRHWGTPAYEVDSPFLTRDLVDRLIAANPTLVGIDALNVDDVNDTSRPAHHSLLGAGILILEHLTNVSALPTSGARLTAVPAPIEGMGTMPVRAFARIDNPSSP